MIRVKKGLDLPIYGIPEQKIYRTHAPSQVALVGPDYLGMRPTMQVQVGDRVKKGQVIFTCKKREGVKYTAPGGGEVVAVNRGERRAFETLVIQLDSPEQEQQEGLHFDPISNFSQASKEQVEKTLVDSGLWTALRTRPYSKCPLPGSTPTGIFVQAMDTHPLAADQELIIHRNLAAFHHGLRALKKLTEGNVVVCATGATTLTAPAEGIKLAKFSGPHPSGNVGTHIHFLGPASESKTYWSLDAQDAIAIGHLFLHGELNTTRVVALSGPQVKAPRLLETRIGACLDELTADQLKPGESRVISGSVLYGRTSCSRFHFLSRYARQVTALKEGREREFLGWQSPGINKFSTRPIYLSTLTPDKKFLLTTTTHGSPRAMVPIGMYEKVMPLDILPTPLLRALCSRDTESAQKLGALELDEEDLALCTFVDPGKVDYGPILRENLEMIEREG